MQKPPLPDQPTSVGVSRLNLPLDGRGLPLIKSKLVPIALCLVCLLGGINYRFAPQFDFALFYLTVIACATWFGGRTAGLIVSAASWLATIVVELGRLSSEPNGWLTCWSLVTQAVLFAAVTLLISGIHNLTLQSGQRIKDRTTALEREIQERKQAEAQLLKTTQQLRQLADNIADVFWIRNLDDPRMVYASPAYETVWGRTCRDLYLSPTAWLESVHPEDRDRLTDAFQTKQASGKYHEEYRILRPDGTPRWIRDRAFPIRDASGKVVRIVGIAEDVTERHHLEHQILEISDREQGRLGQDLHDSLCQKLISIAFDNNSLKKRLSVLQLPETVLTERLAHLLDDAITEARTMARGLFPVQLETDGLHVALQQMAASVNERFKVNCEAHCEPSVLVKNNGTATHLYRIAQEAVNNSIKHANATTISIRLRQSNQLIELCVKDDGAGITMSPTPGAGMGLHIMEYRVRAIGGTLHIKRSPTGGTSVSCSIPEQPS